MSVRSKRDPAADNPGGGMSRGGQNLHDLSSQRFARHVVVERAGSDNREHAALVLLL